MSSRCPFCKAEIHSDEFGLISCPSCGAQIMLGIDEPSTEVRTHDQPPTLVDAPDVSEPSEAPGATAAEGMPISIPMPDNHPTESASSEPLVPETEPSQNAAADLSDIADYGNSALSQARDGTLRFHLYLTNIDTADIRKSVREILTDSRFLFDVDQIMNSIRDGAVKISDVTPVKAAILVQRLRPLSVGISWEQYAIHTA